MVPLAVLERDDPRGLVVGRVVVVDVGQAADRAAPAAQYERAAAFTDRKGKAAEKVASRHPHRIEGDFVVRLKQRAAPRHAGHVVADFEVDCAVLHIDISLAAEISDLPLPQRFAIEETGFWRRLRRDIGLNRRGWLGGLDRLDGFELLDRLVWCGGRA